MKLCTVDDRNIILHIYKTFTYTFSTDEILKCLFKCRE